MFNYLILHKSYKSMKRLFQLTILLGISINAFSQIERGTLTVGGSIYGNGYSITTNDDDPEKFVLLGLNPSVGILIIDNFELRLSPRYSYSKASQYTLDLEAETIHSSISLGFKAIKYFGETSFKPFIGVGFHSGLDWSKQESVGLDYYGYPFLVDRNSKTINTLGSADLGIAYFLNEYISIITSIDYTRLISNKTLEIEGLDFDIESKTKKSSIYFRVGFGIFL